MDELNANVQLVYHQRHTFLLLVGVCVCVCVCVCVWVW